MSGANPRRHDCEPAQVLPLDEAHRIPLVRVRGCLPGICWILGFRDGCEFSPSSFALSICAGAFATGGLRVVGDAGADIMVVMELTGS